MAAGREARLSASAEAASLGELREKCLRARAIERDAAHERIRRDRSVREWIDGEGAWNLHARGTVDAGARFRAAHAAIVDRASGAVDGQPTRSRNRVVGLIRADIEALQRGSVEGDEICDLPGLGPIPVRVAQDLVGNAVLKLVITKGVDVANVTDLGRSPTFAQRVALLCRSPECTNEHCTRTFRLENDLRCSFADARAEQSARRRHLGLDDVEVVGGADLREREQYLG